jgi:hypothetical protein
MAATGGAGIELASGEEDVIAVGEGACTDFATELGGAWAVMNAHRRKISSQARLEEGAGVGAEWLAAASFARELAGEACPRVARCGRVPALKRIVFLVFFLFDGLALKQRCDCKWARQLHRTFGHDLIRDPVRLLLPAVARRVDPELRLQAEPLLGGAARALAGEARGLAAGAGTLQGKDRHTGRLGGRLGAIVSRHELPPATKNLSTRRSIARIIAITSARVGRALMVAIVAAMAKSDRV